MKGNTNYANNGFYDYDFRRGVLPHGECPGNLNYLNQMTDGSNGDGKKAVTRKTLIIPLLSSFMGHLIPPDQHRLLPGSFLGNI